MALVTHIQPFIISISVFFLIFLSLGIGSPHSFKNIIIKKQHDYIFIVNVLNCDRKGTELESPFSLFCSVCNTFPSPEISNTW